MSHNDSNKQQEGPPPWPPEDGSTSTANRRRVETQRTLGTNVAHGSILENPTIGPLAEKAGSAAAGHAGPSQTGQPCPAASAGAIPSLERSPSSVGNPAPVTSGTLGEQQQAGQLLFANLPGLGVLPPPRASLQMPLQQQGLGGIDGTYLDPLAQAGDQSNDSRQRLQSSLNNNTATQPQALPQLSPMLLSAVLQAPLAGSWQQQQLPVPLQAQMAPASTANSLQLLAPLLLQQQTAQAPVAGPPPLGGMPQHQGHLAGVIGTLFPGNVRLPQVQQLPQLVTASGAAAAPRGLSQQSPPSPARRTIPEALLSRPEPPSPLQPETTVAGVRRYLPNIADLLDPEHAPGAVADPMPRPVRKHKKPKRPLTAYNIYFREQRAAILASREPQFSTTASDWKKRKGRSAPHGKIRFQELGRTIGGMWRALSNEGRRHYEEKANEDKERYKRELDHFKEEEEKYLEATRQILEASVSEETKQRYFGSQDGNV